MVLIFGVIALLENFNKGNAWFELCTITVALISVLKKRKLMTKLHILSVPGIMSKEHGNELLYCDIGCLSCFIRRSEWYPEIEAHCSLSESTTYTFLFKWPHIFPAFLSVFHFTCRFLLSLQYFIFSSFLLPFLDYIWHHNFPLSLSLPFSLYLYRSFFSQQQQ